jgi:membrane-associated phospholipid phosphatase
MKSHGPRRIATILLLGFRLTVAGKVEAEPKLSALDSSASLPEPSGVAEPGPSPGATPNLRLHVILTALGAASWTSLVLFYPEPTRCSWCDRNSDGSNSLNRFDSSIRETLRWSNPKAADTLSTVFSFGLAPLAGFGIGSAIAGYDSRLDEVPTDLLVIAESAVLALNVNELSKRTFARERPFVHARSPSDRSALRSNSDDLSFFSGHATLAFALATSAGTVASLRRYRLAPLMWSVGMLFAATGGYLRIAADQHYASDVLAGAFVGAASGFAVPYFAHRTRGARLGIVPYPGGVSVVGVW